MGRGLDILLPLIEQRKAVVGIVGMGYVGLPLAMAVCRAGFPVIGLDIDTSKVEALNASSSYINAVSSEELAGHVASGKFKASADKDRIAECQIIVICVPTPLTRQREPDLFFVRVTGEDISSRMKPGTLVVLESTTYPGTTTEVLKPILEKSGLRAGTDFFVGFSPEREDPGNKDFHTSSIPKVVSGDGPDAAKLVTAFYGAVVDKVVPVSTPETAEAVKITENVFRAINIALVNELKVVYDAMGIDVWEVINAAKTKPFGFQAFYPGPGLGGHCIPIDPFYLTWKAREYDISTHFIELAGQINSSMPRYVIAKLEQALSDHAGKALKGARVLVMGLAYKKNVADMRESPSFKLMEILEHRGAVIDYHDDHIPVITPTREHAAFTGRKSVQLTAATLSSYDAVLISTDHDGVDYGLVATSAKLIVDTRNCLVGYRDYHSKVVKA